MVEGSKTQQYQLYLKKTAICFFCGFPQENKKPWRPCLASDRILFPPGATSRSKHLLWRCHEGNNLPVSLKVGEILHCHSIWCLGFSALQQPSRQYMKHPLNHCFMDKVHGFSHSGEPVWYIQILRCMQFRAFCESLRATCQPGDFSQM